MRGRGWLAIPVAAAALLAILLWPRGIEDVQLKTGEHYAHGRFEIEARSPSQLHRDHDRLTLELGDIEVAVAKHPEPVRLTVSHGDIEVVGTRFTVHQEAASGRVTLHEGVIRFVSGSETTTLAPGETLEWPARPRPEAAPPAPEPEPEAPAPPSKPKPTVHREPAVIHETDAEWLLSEVEIARSRADYGEAVRLLDKGLAGLVSTKTRERFSYELGSILTFQLNDARACEQWAKHEAAFPRGRYAQEVARAKEKAKCAPR